MCCERQWLPSDTPGPVLLVHFHRKATIVLHKCAVISQSKLTTTKHPASISNSSSHLNPPRIPFRPTGVLRIENLSCFVSQEKAWEINDGRFGCGTLLMLLSDFDVLNMCGPGNMPDERARVCLRECVFAWGVCRVWQTSWKLSQLWERVCLRGITLGTGLSGAKISSSVCHLSGSGSASQHWQNNDDDRERLFFLWAGNQGHGWLHQMCNYSLCVCFLYRDERRGTMIKAKSFVRDSVML